MQLNQCLNWQLNEGNHFYVINSVGSSNVILLHVGKTPKFQMESFIYFIAVLLRFFFLFFYKIYHGLGFGGSNGVLMPLPTFTTLLSISKLLMDSLLGERVFGSDDGVGGCKRLI